MTYLLILGYFIFQRALQANGFAFELIKGLRHAFVVVITYRCVVVNVCAGILVTAVGLAAGRRRRHRTGMSLGSSRHGPTLTEGSVKGRNVGVFFVVASASSFRVCQLLNQLVSRLVISLLRFLACLNRG
jgi:hypothetical protein